jgi:hypothetical protein
MKKRKAPKDKKLKVSKKYLAGLKGAKRSARASLLKRMAKMYKKGMRIPMSLFKARVK